MSEPSTVLVVVPTLNVGGTERQLSQKLPRLTGPRHAIVVCTLGDKGLLAPALERQGVKVYSLSRMPLPVPQVRLPSRLWWVLRVSLALWRLIGTLKPSIIHFYLPAAYLVGGLVATLRGGSTLVMSRRSLNDYQKRRPILKWVEQLLHKRMAVVLGNSMAVVDQLASEGVPRDRLGLIYNGVDLMPFGSAKSRSAARAAIDIDDDVFVMIKVANLVPYKGYQDLLTALGRIREQLPPSWLLLCVGSGQELQENLWCEAKRLGIEANLRFLGARSDVPDILAAADLGLLCSHEEGFPNAILEYMAAGLPVIATNVGGSPEATVPGETGLLVDARDSAALGGAILDLAGDPERTKWMGRAGRRRIEEYFSLERCVAKYRALYDGLSNGSSLPVADIIADSKWRPRGGLHEPTVSVVIPVYNRRNLIPRAIASVLDQTYEVFEVLVVDDGSEEDIESAVREVGDPRIRIIRHPTNLGPASARNTGVRAARGALVAFLDSDDTWLPQKLESQIRALTVSAPGARAVVSGYILNEISTAKQTDVRLDSSYDAKKERVWGCRVSPGSTLLTYRDCFETVGLFDEDLRRLEDWDWIIRFADSYRMLAVPEPLAIIHHDRREIKRHILPALTYIETKHRKAIAKQGASEIRKFRSTLAIERASVEFRSERLAKAIGWTLKAVMIYPRRNWSFFKRIVRMGLGSISLRVIR